MTKAEQELIEGVMRCVDPVAQGELESAVLKERLTPALMQRAVMAFVAVKRAGIEHTAVWEALHAAGVNGKFRVPPIYDEIEAAAVAILVKERQP